MFFASNLVLLGVRVLGVRIRVETFASKAEHVLNRILEASVGSTRARSGHGTAESHGRSTERSQS